MSTVDSVLTKKLNTECFEQNIALDTDIVNTHYTTNTKNGSVVKATEPHPGDRSLIYTEIHRSQWYLQAVMLCI